MRYAISESKYITLHFSERLGVQNAILCILCSMKLKYFFFVEDIVKKKIMYIQLQRQVQKWRWEERKLSKCC